MVVSPLHLRHGTAIGLVLLGVAACGGGNEAAPEARGASAEVPCIDEDPWRHCVRLIVEGPGDARGSVLVGLRRDCSA